MPSRQTKIGRWIVYEKLGKGGQATTEVVRDLTGELVGEFVLKKLKPWKPGNPERTESLQRSRFELEVGTLRTLAKAECPNIVQVIDTNLAPEDGSQPWYVMPRYEVMWRGDRDPQYLEPYKGNIDRVLEIEEQLADALAFMHRFGRGNIHRDVKSGNVFFQEVGSNALLGDFGLVYTPDTNRESETGAHDHLGPGRWRPPELRIGGHSPRHHGSDVYLLGGLMFELLSGGESIDETEQPEGSFTHELPRFDLTRFTTDSRLPYVNQLLCNMLRRDPYLRISAQDVSTLCKSIREWKESDPPINMVSSLQEAEAAAARFRARSKTAQLERLMHELEITCDSIAKEFGLRKWAPKYNLTRMVDKNWGDSKPLSHAQSQFPKTVWMAVRILVAFETDNERPMMMSYVFLGRTEENEEVVAKFDESGNWEVLTTGPPGEPKHESLIRRVAAEELDRLVRKITSIIEQL